MKLEEIKLRQRVLVASEKEAGWQPGKVVALSSITGLVGVEVKSVQGVDVLWVAPGRLKTDAS